MDDLKKKLNGLFKSKASSSSSRKFRGQGQKLGSAPTSDTHHHPAQRVAPPPASAKPQRSSAAPTSSTHSKASEPLSAVTGYQPPPVPKFSHGQPVIPSTTSGQATFLSEEGEMALGLLVSGEQGHLASGMLRKVQAASRAGVSPPLSTHSGPQSTTLSDSVSVIPLFWLRPLVVCLQCGS